jgi:adenylate cyclase
MRHLAIGSGTIKELEDLKGPMSDILDQFMAQTNELARYKRRYGELPSPSPGSSEEEEEEDDDDPDTEEGSDTEQEL